MGTADFIRTHRMLRPLLDPARRVRAHAQRLAAPTGRARVAGAQLALRVRALPARTALGRRRSELSRALAALPDSLPEPRLVSVVCGPGTRLAPPPRDVATELVTRVADATGALVCFLAPTAQGLDARWLAHLTAAVHDDIVAATPLLVRADNGPAHGTAQDLLVAAFGHTIAVVDDAPVVRARAGGAAPSALTQVETVDAGASACFVVDRVALDAAGGIDEQLSPDAAMIDLSVRLRAGGGRIVAVPTSILADHHVVRTRAELTDPFAIRPADWYAAVARRGPLLLRSARNPPLPRVAVTTAVPSAKVAPRWGDWHFGADLARALRRRGHEVRLQTADEADTVASRACDIQLVLHGLVHVARTEGQRHVIWVISHPETLGTAEADAADLVFVASERFAGALRARTRTPVEVLLQATDHHRFHPRPVDPRFAHPVVVVAKTRTVLRPIVADALAAGIRPAIYGSGWEEFVDPSLVVAPYVANEDLPLVYASAGVVLNDHWATMRADGFVSNRIFDALACGTPVISDHLSEIAALFGDSVPTYEGPDDLGAQVRWVLGDPAAARARADTGRARVLAAHTFDHRARAIADAIARHRLFTEP